MVDGGDEITYKYLINLMDRETRESLQKQTAVHEGFIGYLLDTVEE